MNYLKKALKQRTEINDDTLKASPKTLGQQLKDWRVRMAYTQSEVSKKIGVSANTVARYERDELFPEHTVLKKISTLIGGIRL